VLARERGELAAQPETEQRELASIYVGRGLSPALAHEVAQQLMAHDALAAHGRDELGITEELAARPLQAALASAATFGVGAALPIAIVTLVSPGSAVMVVAGASLVLLAALGALAAGVGGASPWVGAARVTFWGAIALATTALIGRLFGTTVT
jgi:VIT1/CCC1 family predicted Fe2+/Mn2+ transporter